MTATRISDHETYRARSRSEKFQGYSDLEVMGCPVCGVTYAVPAQLLEHARSRPHIYWCCPNGDELHFPGQTPEQKLRDEQNRRASLQARLDQTEASLKAQRGATTRVRNEKNRIVERVAAGVCPCCNRSFKDLARHMAAKHPEFKATEEAKS